MSDQEMNNEEQAYSGEALEQVFGSDGNTPPEPVNDTDQGAQPEEAVSSDQATDVNNDPEPSVEDDGTPSEDPATPEQESEDPAAQPVTQAQFQELMAMIQERQAQREQQNEPEPDPVQQPAPNTPVPELSQEEFDKILQNPEALTGYMQKQFSLMQEQAIQAAHKQALQTWQMHQYVQDVSRAFFKKHPEFTKEKHGDTLMLLAQRELNNGEKNLSKALESAAAKAKSAFNMDKPDKGKPTTPNLATSPHKGGQTPQKPQTEQERLLSETFG